MKISLNTILFFSILTIVSSCNGQNTTPSNSKALSNQNLTPEEIGAFGDIVSAIDTSIWYIFQDRNNNFWFGSNGQGVYSYDSKKIIHFSSKDGLCNNQLRGIQQDNSGNMYFNTVNGISKFDGQVFTTLKSTGSNLSNDGWRLHPDDLWFAGAQDSGVVYRYDGTNLYRLKFPKTREGEAFISEYPRSKYPHMTFSPYDVYSIYKDRKGNLWFGTNIGLCRYDGNAFAWMSEKELGIDAISFHVRSTIEDRKGDFWFSNAMHRFKVHSAGKGQPTTQAGSISFSEEKGIVNSNDHDAAYFLSGIEDSNGDLWLVTYNKGVWRYDGEKLTQYPVKDGNENFLLFSIYQDKQGGLWLGTHTSGVYKFNGKSFEKFRF
jgi:ligand-binding sensor domain-containing protein